MTNQRDRILAAGWQLKEFAPGVFKWWRPAKDDGARYVDTPKALQRICEDYSL